MRIVAGGVSYLGESRLRNDGSDSISINGVDTIDAAFEFHSKPLRKELRVVLRWLNADGEEHDIEFWNNL
jgi:hypothetical protein